MTAQPLLLDTHVFLWLQTEPERLGPLRSQLEDVDTELLLSSASAWEIAIKWAIGRLPLPERPEVYVPDRMARSSVTALPITHAHALATDSLPPHHNDPFDRLLLAQATIDGLMFVTADSAMRAYDVELLWVAGR